jgi:hypothetical protein
MIFNQARGRTMTVASVNMTLEEFLNYDDGTDTLYELENGDRFSDIGEFRTHRRSDSARKIGEFPVASYNPKIKIS